MPVTPMSFESLVALKVTPGQEQDFRATILNALIATPHKDLTLFIPLFRHVHEEDPMFFVRLALWYFYNGTVRDLKHLFIALLSISKFSSDFREVGLYLLMKSAPFEVKNILDIIRGYKGKDGKWVPGLATNPPRSFRMAVRDYLHYREGRPEQFYGMVIRARKIVRSLYASLHITPGQLAQEVLFDGIFKPGTLPYIVKQIANSNDAAEQARLIVENKIAYPIAASIIDTMSPPVIAALVGVMSSQELINNMASLKKRGAMDNPQIRKLIQEKLEVAKNDKNVATLKTRTAVTAADLDEEMAKSVTDVGDAKVRKMNKITKPTALLIDKSGSMDKALEIGKTLAALIAPICANGLYVYVFDAAAAEIKPKGNELSDWEAAFRGYKASGNTFANAPIMAMSSKNQRVEQIIYVTDEGENGTPTSGVALKAYAQSFGVQPNVVIIRVAGNQGLSDQMQRSIKNAGFEVETFSPGTDKNDYYSLPSLSAMLSAGSRMDLLNKIMDMDLPQRKRNLGNHPGEVNSNEASSPGYVLELAGNAVIV